MPPKQRSNRVELPGKGRKLDSRLLVVLGGGVLVGVVAIVLSLTLGGGHKKTAPTTVIANLSAVTGIAQHGLVLGNPRAKVTLTEYVDTSCPICKDYSLSTFPTLSKRYVRTGKVKIEARVLAFVGPSSSRGRAFLLAAARQDKAWQLAELLYQNQGDETQAWLTDDFARALAAKIPGLNADTLFADASSEAVQVDATKADSEAQAERVSGTPTFVLTTPDGARHLLGSGSPGITPFEQALDRALKG